MFSLGRCSFLAVTGNCLLLLLAVTLAEGQVEVKPNSKTSAKVTPCFSVEKKVKAITVDQLGVEPKKVTAKARFVQDLAADDLDVVELIMTFEDAFDIEIPDEAAGKMHTVQDAVDYICQHAKAGK